MDQPTYIFSIEIYDKFKVTFNVDFKTGLNLYNQAMVQLKNKIGDDNHPNNMELNHMGIRSIVRDKGSIMLLPNI